MAKLPLLFLKETLFLLNFHIIKIKKNQISAFKKIIANIYNINNHFGTYPAKLFDKICLRRDEFLTYRPTSPHLLNN